MRIARRHLLATAAAAGFPLSARAQTPTIKFGVLTDMSGPYQDVAGPGAIAATKMAMAEFKANGFNVEMVSADHQNKPDVGVGIVRQWFDRDGVDVILEVANSAVTLGAGVWGREREKEKE